MKQLLAILAVGILLFGCVNIEGTAKAASFGKKPGEQKAYDYFKGKYGDPNGAGAPRIIEPIVTTSITDFMPADKVLKYNKDVPAFHVWFFYDNFAETDAITVTFTYLDDGTTIHTFNSKGGGDYGAGSFTLQKPDEGWPLGNYEVVVSGKGVSESVKFEVIDGPTVKEALPYDAPAGASDSAPSGTTQPPATGQPATTAGMTSDPMFFDTGNNYLGGCSLTDSSKFTLDKAMQVSLLQVWYNWASGESVITYTLEKGGDSFLSGSMVRADCDPYQGNWCNGNHKISKEFPAGDYELKVSSPKMCLKPSATGIVRIYGKASSSQATQPSQEEEKLLFDTTPNYIGACSLTDKSEFTLSSQLSVTKLKVWYNWAGGEQSVTYKLERNDESISEGTITKTAECDTYQKNWCNGVVQLNMPFPPAKYELKLSKAMMCLEPGKTGTVRLYGMASGVAAAAQLPAGIPAHLTNCQYSGSWNTDWGTMQLSQDGSKVTGTYTHDSGKLLGTLVDGVYVGKWSEYPSYSEPGDAGDMVFYFTKDCNGFTGNWQYGVHTTGGWSGTWVGTKAA